MNNEAEGKQRARPRAPSRRNGVTRFAALLDAAETLLREQSPDNIGLYDIAKAAGASPASVYHFFPTKEAALVALVQRYIEGLATVSQEPISANRLLGWQDLMRIEQDRARSYFGSKPAALKLLYGGYGNLETRRIEHQFTSCLANGMYERYDRVFHMPYIAVPGMKFHISLSIMDTVWSFSYLKEGRVTEEFATEALAACLAYCRLFLPERIEVRQSIRVLAAEGGQLILPIR